MKRLLINASHTDELRVATTNDAILIDLNIENPGLEQKKSNIYKGKITSIEPSLGAVFVDYGSERHGFLPLKEVSPEYFVGDNADTAPENVDIKKVLKEGQEIVIQVDKEERGTKGAALTTFITLAGSYLVLMPNNPCSGGISRRIEGEDRDQLKEAISKLKIPEGMGIIVRTAGVGKTSEELSWDLNVLLRYWEAIKQAAVARPGPYLIHQESDMIIRTIRDNLRQDIGEIIIDDTNAFLRAKDYIAQIRPDFIHHVKHYDDHLPLFSRFQIERQIEAAYQREVRLPSGGSIVIDHSEALVAIDINSAKATKGTNIEETALATNLEAADEIAKQLRIRDLGGLIVIDFIDMTPAKNQREVENRLRDALHMDRARIQIGRISRFGLLEMSRQRLRSSLSTSTQITCPRCDGRGTIRGIESIALSLVHLLQEHASRTSNAHLQIQLPVDVATYIINEKRSLIEALEAHSSAKVTIIPNQHLKSPHYQLKVCKDEHSKSTPSYKLVKIPKAEAPQKKAQMPASLSEPAISQYLSEDALTPAPRKSQANGLVKRLWELMFGTSTPEKKPLESPAKSEKARKNPRAATQRQKESTKPSQQRRHPQKDSKGSKQASATDTQRSSQKHKRQTPQDTTNKQRDQKRTTGKGESAKKQASHTTTKEATTKKKDSSAVKANKAQTTHADKAPRKEKPKTEPSKKENPKDPKMNNNVTPAPQRSHEKLEEQKPTTHQDQKTTLEQKVVADNTDTTNNQTVTASKATETKSNEQPATAVKQESPVEKEEAAVLTAPTQSALSYQQAAYKGLSSGKPMQQVTTKKAAATSVKQASNQAPAAEETVHATKEIDHQEVKTQDNAAVVSPTVESIAEKSKEGNTGTTEKS